MVEPGPQSSSALAVPVAPGDAGSDVAVVPVAGVDSVGDAGPDVPLDVAGGVVPPCVAHDVSVVNARKSTQAELITVDLL